MSVLGPGVRVWIGWFPQLEGRQDPVSDPRNKRGVIALGPFRGVQPFTLAGRRVRIDMKNPHWIVDVDGGGRSLVDEAFLFPIDDDGELYDREGKVDPVKIVTSPLTTV